MAPYPLSHRTKLGSGKPNQEERYTGQRSLGGGGAAGPRCVASQQWVESPPGGFNTLPNTQTHTQRGTDPQTHTPLPRGVLGPLVSPEVSEGRVRRWRRQGP